MGLSGGVWRGKRLQAREGGGQLAGPGPMTVQAQAGLAGVAGQARGGVPEAVAQRLRFGARELAGQQQLLGPGEQVLASWVSSSQTSLLAKD